MKKKETKWFSFIRSVFLVLLSPFVIFLAFLHIAALSAAFIPPISFPLVAVFGLILPFTFILVLISIPILLLLKSKWIILQLLLLIVSIPSMRNFVHIGNEKNLETDIHLTSYNLLGYRGFQPTNNKMEPVDGINDYLAQKTNDIICLQEFRSWSGNLKQDIETLKLKLGFSYHKTELYWTKGGLTTDSYLILSKYPIIHSGSITASTRRNIGIFTDLQIDNQAIRVFTIHLASFGLKANEIEMFGEAAVMEMEKVKQHGKTVVSKLVNNFRLRHIEVESLMHAIDTTTIPIIICGDVNETAASYIYRELRKKNLIDSHTQAGNYFGTTYAGKLPLLRIDHILHSQEFTTSYSKIDEVEWSDHFPLRVGLQLKPNK